MPKTDLHKELIKLKSKSNLNINLDFDPNKIESNRLFHIDDIKKICIDYRLRFLDFDYFKGKVPQEAYDKLKNFKFNNPNLDIKIMMMAPSKLFELENYDLFIFPSFHMIFLLFLLVLTFSYCFLLGFLTFPTVSYLFTYF